MPAEVNSKYPLFPKQRQVSDFSWKSYNHVSSPFFPDWTGRATGKHSLSPEHPRLPLYAASGSCVQWHTPICLDVKMAEGARSCWFQLTSIFIRINSNFTKCKFSKHNELLYFFKKKKKKDSCCFHNSQFLPLKMLWGGSNGWQNCRIAMLWGSSHHLNLHLQIRKLRLGEGKKKISGRTKTQPPPHTQCFPQFTTQLSGINSKSTFWI